MTRPDVPLADPAAGWRKLYPFQSRHLLLDGLRYHYVDEGEGEPLLLVHGNPTWSFHWRELIAAWRTRYRAVAPDHLGCGLSAKPRRWGYRLADHVGNLLRLVEALDLREITLVAQDWGGAIGLGAALQQPERFARFVLFNTGAFRPWFIPWRIRVCRWPLVGRAGVQGLNLFARAAQHMAVARGRLAPEVRAGYLAPYGGWHDRQAIYQFVEDIPLVPTHPTWHTLAAIEERLPSLADRPFQFIWGMRDWCFTPACLEKFIELLPGADVHRIADAGHWVVEDAAQEAIGVVENFLTAHPLPAGETSQP